MVGQERVSHQRLESKRWRGGGEASLIADEAALLATRAKATTGDDLDALIAQYGFEEGDDCSSAKGEKKKSGGGGRKKKKKGK
jgi:hypothetical protein